MADNNAPLPSLDERRYLKPFHLYMRCPENQAESAHDGGLVLLQAIAWQDGVGGLLGANLPLQFAVDGDKEAETGMHAFARVKDETRECYYKVTIEEVDQPFPNDPPAAETEVARLLRENEALRQQLMAAGPEDAPG